MGRPVVAGDTGPVDAEHHRQPVEPDVEVDLVDGAGEERRVDGDHRPEPAHGHARGGGDGVLLGDADVDDALGPSLLERAQAGRPGHGRGDGHQIGPALAQFDHRPGEDLGEAAGSPAWGSGGHVEAGRVVEAPLAVGLGRAVAPSLLGEDVDDDRPVVLRGEGEDALHPGHVVAVDRPHVADTEVLEEAGGADDHLPGRGPDPVDAAVEVLPDLGHAPHRPLEPVPALDVRRAEAQPGQPRGQPADRRGVGAAVVVEDDQHPALAVAQVVQGLVGHAARHRAVADHGHDATGSLAVEPEGDGEAVGVAQDRGRVAVLDPVVLGLRPARVARQATGLAQASEPLLSTGDDLVHVGLVAGVPEEDVAGRVEHPVQGERELDHPEVRAQMAAVGRHRADDELADLSGERRRAAPGPNPGDRLGR